MAGKYATIGCSLWSWSPLLAVGSDQTGISARLLWLALYSSPQAMRLVPGLWEGPPSAMADLLRLPLDVTWNAMERLREHGLFEYDVDSRVGRLTALPDTTSRAHNDKAIYGWWSGFQTLPSVLVRNIHVHLLWWLVSSGKVSQMMRDAWDKTFGTINVPPAPVLVPRVAHQETLPFDGGRTPVLADQVISGTLDVPGTSRSRSRSRSTGEEERGESVRGEGEGEVQNESSSDDHPLVLRPADEPFSVNDLVTTFDQALGGRRILAPEQQQELEREILNLSPKPDLGLLGEYLSRTRCSARDAALFLSGTGHLASAFSQARQWAREQEERQKRAAELAADLARARAIAGV